MAGDSPLVLKGLSFFENAAHPTKKPRVFQGIKGKIAIAINPPIG
jgi:hypothetical protein